MWRTVTFDNESRFFLWNLFCLTLQLSNPSNRNQRLRKEKNESCLALAPPTSSAVHHTPDQQYYCQEARLQQRNHLSNTHFLTFDVVSEKIFYYKTGTVFGETSG